VRVPEPALPLRQLPVRICTEQSSPLPVMAIKMPTHASGHPTLSTMQQLVVYMLVTSREVRPTGWPAKRPADTKRKILLVVREPFSCRRLSYFLLMAISASALFPLVRVDLMPFTFSTAGHRSSIYSVNGYKESFVIMFLNSFDGLNTGTFRSGTGTTSPVRGFRALRAFRTFILKVPKPLISML